MIVPITPELLRPLLPPRPADAHKGTFGHVLVIAGSRGFLGAARLCCEAAGRSGAGLVTLALPETLCDAVAPLLLESMCITLPSTAAATLDESGLHAALGFAQTRDAVVIGPGVSQHASTQRFIRGFVEGCAVPLIIDADGLNALRNRSESLAHRPASTVLTPHPGEMARLLNTTTPKVQQDRTAAATELAKSRRCVVILKGNRTIVASPDGMIHENRTGNPGMATGGTGDVLAGLVGGLLAQRISALDAALIAVYVHGLAGDLAAKEMTGRAMLARDVVRHLSGAWRALEQA